MPFHEEKQNKSLAPLGNESFNYHAYLLPTAIVSRYLLYIVISFTFFFESSQTTM